MRYLCTLGAYMTLTSPSADRLTLRVCVVAERPSTAAEAVVRCAHMLGPSRATPPIIDLGQDSSQDRAYVTVSWTLDASRRIEVRLMSVSMDALAQTDAHSVLWVRDSDDLAPRMPSGFDRDVVVLLHSCTDASSCFDGPKASMALWTALKSGLRLAVERDRAVAVG